MWKLFFSPLNDHFQFGLWPEHGITKVPGMDGKFGHPYMTRQLLISLRDIACHDAWEGDLEMFRDVLMCAI